MNDNITALIESARHWPNPYTNPTKLIVGLADALEAEHKRAEAASQVGSCWNQSPRMIATEGQCAPQPKMCDLPAGHAGAHRSGTSQWMTLDPLRAVEAERDRYRAAIQNAYNAWHMETRATAIDILTRALNEGAADV